MKKNNMQMATVFIAAINVGSLVQAFLLPSNPLGPISSASTSCSSPRACGVIMRADQEDGASMIKPMDRKVALQSAVLTLGAALVINPSINVASGVDFSKVRADIEDIIDKDANKGPTFVRLAWHSSGTYDKMSKTGGSQGGTMRFKEEQGDGSNAGLSNAVKWLQPIKDKYPDISHGDLYTLAGVTAIEKMGGPKISWRYGRKDKGIDAVPPSGRLPDADKGNPMATAKGLRDVFYRMGFNDREIVALSGAHALGRCHPNYSGYEGPWTPTPNLFAGAIYFKLLKNVTWTERENFKPFQYQDPSGALMMLPSDIVLLEDKKFKKYVDMYASDDKLFFEDFAKAFSTLLELGTKDLKDVSA